MILFAAWSTCCQGLNSGSTSGDLESTNSCISIFWMVFPILSSTPFMFWDARITKAKMSGKNRQQKVNHKTTTFCNGQETWIRQTFIYITLTHPPSLLICWITINAQLFWQWIPPSALEWIKAPNKDLQLQRQNSSYRFMRMVVAGNIQVLESTSLGK